MTRILRRHGRRGALLTGSVLRAASSGVILPAWGCGARTRELLRSRGYDVEWHEHPVPHSLCAREAGDLRAWLLWVLPPRG